MKTESSEEVSTSTAMGSSSMESSSTSGKDLPFSPDPLLAGASTTRATRHRLPSELATGKISSSREYSQETAPILKSQKTGLGATNESLLAIRSI